MGGFVTWANFRHPRCKKVWLPGEEMPKPGIFCACPDCHADRVKFAASVRRADNYLNPLPRKVARAGHVVAMHRYSHAAWIGWLQQAVWHFEFTGTFADEKYLADTAVNRSDKPSIHPAGANRRWDFVLKRTTKGRSQRQAFKYVRATEKGKVNARLHYHALIHAPAELARRFADIWEDVNGFCAMLGISSNPQYQKGVVEEYVTKHMLKDGRRCIGETMLVTSSRLPDAMTGHSVRYLPRGS